MHGECLVLPRKHPDTGVDSAGERQTPSRREVNPAAACRLVCGWPAKVRPERGGNRGFCVGNADEAASVAGCRLR